MGRNRIEDGSPEALFCEAYDQAATAVAAHYLGLPVPPMTLVDDRPDDWRYRDDIFGAISQRPAEGDMIPYVTLYGIGSAAQCIAQNVDHPFEGMMGGASSPAHDFARQHWAQIEAVAKRLLNDKRLKADQLSEMVQAS